MLQRDDTSVPSHPRRVVCKETGDIYESVTEVSRQIGVSVHTVKQSIRFGNLCSKRTWEYFDPPLPPLKPQQVRRLSDDEEWSTIGNLATHLKCDAHDLAWMITIGRPYEGEYYEFVG